MNRGRRASEQIHKFTLTKRQKFRVDGRRHNFNFFLGLFLSIIVLVPVVFKPSAFSHPQIGVNRDIDNSLGSQAPLE